MEKEGCWNEMGEKREVVLVEQATAPRNGGGARGALAPDSV